METIDLAPAVTPEEIEDSEKWTPSTMGKKGGSRKSDAKTKAAQENGKKGGRPKKIHSAEDF